MTIGVIDECRKLGIGSYLLNCTINTVLNNPKWRETCKFIYLHVVSYNTVAIKFYERNGFTNCKLLEEWYEIFEKPYDAILLYKLMVYQP
jgi:ribosomal protein S18 acetylase RimI-like enzyme